MSALDPSRAAGTEDAIAEDLRLALRRESGARRWAFRIASVCAFAALMAGGSVYRLRHLPPPPRTFVSAPVRVSDVVEQVRASAVVTPIEQLNVAAQAAGVVSRVLVDYNAGVKRGDVLAEIDARLLSSQVNEQTANLAAERAQQQSAQSALASAKAAHERAARLFERGSASRAEVDSTAVALQLAESSAAAATANVAAGLAQLGRARTTVQSTKIVAPIDGVVITRDVDPGTVIAPGTAPVLFVLSGDLKRMRVVANVDEADVGKLALGQRATASVDAYPGRTFAGTLQQLRLDPRTLQGVVTYAAVLEVDNDDLALRPGMTAMVTITIAEARSVQVVPNAALRFDAGVSTSVDSALPKGVGRVYVLTNGEPGRETIEARQVQLGTTDGILTELSGSPLKIGTPVVTDRVAGSTKKAD